MKEKPELCPICMAKLSPDDVLQGRCPECGQNLPGVPHAGKQWEGYGAPGAAHDRASVGRGFGAGGGMPPPPWPSAGGYGDGAYQGAAAAAPEGPPRKNVVGLIAVICGLVAVIGVAVGGYGVFRVFGVLETEMVPLMKEIKEKQEEGEIMTGAEQQRLNQELQQRIQKKMTGEAALSNMLCPASVAGLAAIVLGIIGLCKKGYKKGSALLGLLLGIGAGLAGIIMTIVLAVNMTSRMMQAMGQV